MAFAQVDVRVAEQLPSGVNNIGDVDLASAIPAGTNIIGKVGIDTADNTIKISQTGAENGGQLTASLPAGSNIIGKVEIVASTGSEKETYVETAAVVPKNQTATQTVQSALITNLLTGTLTSVIVAARVGMMAEIRKNDGVTPVTLMITYIPATGGQVEVTFENVAKNQLAGDAVDNRFDVFFITYYKNQDAKAS